MKLKYLKLFEDQTSNRLTGAQGLFRLIELGLAELPVRIEYDVNLKCINAVWELVKTPVEARDEHWLSEFHDISTSRVAAFWTEREGSSEDPDIVDEGRVPIARIISDDELKLFGPNFSSPDELTAEIEARAREYIIRIAQTLPVVPVLITETDSGIWYSAESGLRLN